ncbi:MAG: hypothetical protein ACLRFH_03965 [Opitutales bacterium]
MNYKKLLKNVLLSAGTIATASNAAFGITLEKFLNTPKWREIKQMVRDAIKRGDLNSAKNKLRQAGVDNPDQAINDLMAKLDIYSKQIVAQYLDADALLNLVQVSKIDKNIADRMRKNPVAITEKNKTLYSQIQTQQVFKATDLILDKNSTVKIYNIRYEVYGTDIIDIVEKIYINNKNTEFIVFENVSFENIEDFPKVLAHLKEKKRDVKFGIVNLFGDNELDAEREIYQAIQNDQFLKFKKIIFFGAISFNTYKAIKHEPMYAFSKVSIDLSENKNFIEQIECLEADPKVESIILVNRNDNFLSNILSSFAYKINEVDVIPFQNRAQFKNFFCILSDLWREATFHFIETENFYGVQLEEFEPISSNNTNNNVFLDSTIANFYLPFLEYNIDSLFSLFTALDYINFQDHGQTVWLPPYEDINIDILKELMQDYMDRLITEDFEFELDEIINKVKFYTQDQITAIESQYDKFYNFISHNSLEKYMSYINFDSKPEWLKQEEWDNYVLPIKAEAEKLMAVMRGEALPEEEIHVVDDCIVQMRNAINFYMNNEGTIISELGNSGYHVQNVTGDGNCGFYAILQALNPNSNFSSVQRGDNQWQQAEQLRRTMFPDVQNLSQMVTNETPQNEREQHYLPLDNEEVRQAIFRIAAEHGRQVIVINSVYNADFANDDPVNHLFMVLNSDADNGIVPYENFAAALRKAGNNPIVLLYTPGHWQAVLPNN